MKVLLINNLYPPPVRGGAEISVKLLAEALLRTGVEVAVACVEPGAASESFRDGIRVLHLAVSNVGWPIGDSPLGRPRRAIWHTIDAYNPSSDRALRRLIARERPDVVHTNNLQGISVAVWRAAQVAGVPVLHTVRDYYLTCARATRYRSGRVCRGTCTACLPFCRVRQAFSHGVAGVVGTSRFILDLHIALGFFRGANLQLAIDNPLLPDSTHRVASAAEPVTTFGYLGRLEEVKGVLLLLRSFAERSDGGWQLLIAGDGRPAMVAELKRLAGAAARPQQIRFLGWCETADFLSKIDVLIVPSLWDEPWSRAAAEAQAAGVPVIASQRGGLQQLVASGSAGVLFDPDRRDGLARAIDRALGDRDNMLAQANAVRPRTSRYHPDRIAAQYIEAYTAVSKFGRGATAPD